MPTSKDFGHGRCRGPGSLAAWSGHVYAVRVARWTPFVRAVSRCAETKSVTRVRNPGSSDPSEIGQVLSKCAEMALGC